MALALLMAAMEIMFLFWSTIVMTKKKANTDNAELEKEFDQMLIMVRNRKSALRKMMKKLMNSKNENKQVKKPK